MQINVNKNEGVILQDEQGFILIMTKRIARNKQKLIAFLKNTNFDAVNFRLIPYERYEVQKRARNKRIKKAITEFSQSEDCKYKFVGDRFGRFKLISKSKLIKDMMAD